jgi:hypothetical protein
MLIIGEEKQPVKAITKAMRGMFSTTELVGCSMKGQATSKVPNPRPGFLKTGRMQLLVQKFMYLKYFFIKMSDLFTLFFKKQRKKTVPILNMLTVEFS